MIITHDVDEAIYMSDRVCMMTNGPEATVGQVLEIPFDRPRVRSEVLEHAHYYDFRASLLSFLEKQEHAKSAEPSEPETAALSVPTPATEPEFAQELAV